MASYSALVSLMNLLERILHPSQHRILVDKKQIEFLREKVGFFQYFLEDYSQVSSKEKDGLESRMKKAAYAAQDLIETHLLDQIPARSAGIAEKSSTHLFEDIRKLLEEMDLIEKKMLEVKETMGNMKNQQPINSLSNASSRLAPSGQNTMVGFDDKLIQIMDRLTANGQGSNRQVVTITGMGGIGKTTLARNVYDHQFIVQYFDLHSWVTVSQEYSVKEIILVLLKDIYPSRQDSLESNINKLGEQLYKSLFDRRYFIVIDDVWSIEVWNELRVFFPDNCNGSRILITTRESNVAIQCDSYGPFEMDFLSMDRGWELFCEKVFPQEGCPSELEDIGKKIVKNCGGLPLAIVVIGGLLAKSNKTQEYWEYVAENINSNINSGNDEHCLKLLSLSYSHLPIHLKPCFLFMATFPEDCDISVSRLIKLWIAEGFLKPVSGKCLEDVAREYLIDLIERNLILVRRREIIGKMKSCGIHDILRHLCLREAWKEEFLFVIDGRRLHIPPGVGGTRRLSIHNSTWEKRDSLEVFNALQSASFVRSMWCDDYGSLPHLATRFRLLQVLDTTEKYSLEEILQLVNLRYFACMIRWELTYFPISLFWNLQTIILEQMSPEKSIIMPSEIWEMQQLRHLKCRKVVLLPYSSCSHKGKQNSFILENLQSLSTVKDFKFTKDVLKRVPNLKKLKVYCEDLSMGMGMKSLVRLHKLESLRCEAVSKSSIEKLGFPCSLKKLALNGCKLPWKDMSIIGSLPNLEILKLENYAFEGSEWYPVEGEFVKLKFLKIGQNSLVYWVVESHHFPCLEHLVLECLNKLVEVPAVFGELVTLKFIQLNFCSRSAIISAKQILEEQENMGNEDLRVQVFTLDHQDILNLSSKNFQVSRFFSMEETSHVLKFIADTTYQLGQVFKPLSLSHSHSLSLSLSIPKLQLQLPLKDKTPHSRVSDSPKRERG